MLDLRFPWLWMGFGWLLVAGVCFGSLLPAQSVEFALDDKLVHFASYFLLTVWFSGLYSRVGHYGLIALIVIALGAVLDVMQNATATRQFEIFDIFANAAGALIGFIASMLVLGGWCGRIERWIGH
ncbi:MAG: VanZ family protein [Gammaproteobacteria bacterium]|jgi:VanZ family protein